MKRERTLADLYSHTREIDEIMSRKPNWAMRWGIPVMMVSVAAALLACHFVRLPETIDANARITSTRHDSECTAELLIDCRDITKAQIGQCAEIELYAFPKERYATITAHICAIDTVPHSGRNALTAKAFLYRNHPLQTRLKAGLTGKAHITVRNERITKRLLGI